MQLAPGAVITDPAWMRSASRAATVFCGDSAVLRAVQSARLFADSKTFVDRPLLADPEEALAAFAALPALPSGVTDAAALAAFVDRYFGPAGSELEAWSPPDLVLSPLPPRIARVRNPALRTFAGEVHALWTELGRVQAADVAARPQRHSSLPRAHPLVVPGGRFRESYYWDTYFIVRGLVVSGMPVRQ